METGSVGDRTTRLSMSVVVILSVPDFLSSKFTSHPKPRNQKPRNQCPRSTLISARVVLPFDMEKRVTKKSTTRKGRLAKASTRDIFTRQTSMAAPPRKWARYFHRLTLLRDHLLRERGELTADAREEAPQFSQHMADAGTDAYDRDLALSMLSSEQNSLYEIEQALNRIRDGSYGTCELTGKRIARERLEAIPWTRFSAEAERQLERSGAVERTRLGRREKLPRRETTGEVGEEQS